MRIAPVEDEWDGAQPMKRDNRRQECRSGASASSARGRSRLASSLAVEPLEDRQLLSLYTGPTKSRPFFSGGAFYQITLTGPGFQTVSQLGKGHHKIIAINLTGTTNASQLSITQRSVLSGFGAQNTQLQIGRINVQSGQLGGISAASTADLLGSITPLNGAVSTLQFNSLGPNAQINVLGSVGTFQVNTANLGPNGLVHITGNAAGMFGAGGLNLNGGNVIIDGGASGGLNIGGLNVNHGGQFIVGGDVTAAASIGSIVADGGRVLLNHDVTAPLSVGNITVQNAGQFIVNHNLSGGLQVSGAEKILSNGLVQVGNNLGSFTVGQNLSLDSSGKLIVGGDVSGPTSISSGVTVSNNALLSVGRDILGATNVTGDVKLDSGGSISVGRDLNALTVNGNVQFTPSAGTFTVGGNVNALTINGTYQGRGTTATGPELSIGLNLTNLNVLGGASNQGSIANANIAVGKNIVGFNIAHGIFNSLITAGVLIDGSPQNGSTGGNVSADGVDAVFDSEIRAGVQIKNITLNGDVRSDWVTNPHPTGYRTRIIAGEDRQGVFTSGGNIDNFQITGALIDSVLAASVQPNGGDGTLPPTGYGANRTQSNTPGDDGFDTYDAPAGVVVGGTFTNPIAFPNFSEVSYKNETLTGVAYDTAVDPTIDDNILPGAINQSFASTPLPTSVTTTTTTSQTSQSSSTASSTGQGAMATTTTTTTNIAIPTKSTVLGGVISTSHGGNPDANDFAGIFAADTSGVFVGQIPKAQPG
jgi:hypothetical protein